MPVRVYHHTFFAMNTRFSLVFPEISGNLGRILSLEVRRYVDAQEEMTSRFRQGALARINAQAFDGAARVPNALWDVLMQCRRHWEQTYGLFDIALGAYRRRASDAPARSSRPTEHARPNRQYGLDKVVFDEREQSVRFTAPGLVLDLGGIGKGLALKGVKAILERNGVDQAFVSFGESSILALGEHPNGGPWHIGLADVPNTDLPLSNEAMSVSGQTPGREHIVDPRTGAWANGPRMLAVVGECPVEAEVLSTALYIASPAERPRLLSRYGKVRVLDVRSDADFIPTPIYEGSAV
jgi:FAD:protein FMN transferase